MLQKSSIDKTAEIFFLSPTKKHYLMDISRKTGLAHTSVKANLEILTKKGFIIESIEKRGERKFPLYHANLDNKSFRKYKTIHNFMSISELIEYIQEKSMPKSIVLFGSYQRGEDTEDSDIDLFIECKKEEFDLKPFEKKLERKIQLHFNENFKKYPIELKNNIINGIVLSGYLEAL
jgi:predicted nucleotidyltransferase